MTKVLIFLMLLLSVTAVFAQVEPVMPEFPPGMTVILGVIASGIIGFLKKRLPASALVRLLVAVGLSVVTAIAGAFIADVPLGGDADTAFFLTVVFAFSQVTWNTWKSIRDALQS